MPVLIVLNNNQSSLHFGLVSSKLHYQFEQEKNCPGKKNFCDESKQNLTGVSVKEFRKKGQG